MCLCMYPLFRLSYFGFLTFGSLLLNFFNIPSFTQEVQLNTKHKR